MKRIPTTTTVSHQRVVEAAQADSRRAPACNDRTMTDVHVVTVFAAAPDGGNPAPIVLGAADMTDAAMQHLARAYGLESAFVLDPANTGRQVALRFWVPNHEMSMCGHATLGAVGLLHQQGQLPSSTELLVHTPSGSVRARIAADASVTISQPIAHLQTIEDPTDILEALGLTRANLAEHPVRNSTTSSTKTLVPVRDVATLDGLLPQLEAIEHACDGVRSTGLYPYAPSGDHQVDARQFPRSSGYPEDPATGIAATALVFGLLADGFLTADEHPLTIRQGRAMNRPSTITVHVDTDTDTDQVNGCWLGGPVTS